MSSAKNIRTVISLVGSAIGVIAAGTQARRALQKGDKLSLVYALASGARKDEEQ